MFFKRSNGEFRETDRVTRFKLIKSGKNWLRASTSNFGLLKVIRGQVEETIVAEVHEDAVSEKGLTSRGFLKGIVVAAAVLSATSLVHTGYADELGKDATTASALVSAPAVTTESESLSEQGSTDQSATLSESATETKEDTVVSSELVADAPVSEDKAILEQNASEAALLINIAEKYASNHQDADQKAAIHAAVANLQSELSASTSLANATAQAYADQRARLSKSVDELMAVLTVAGFEGNTTVNGSPAVSAQLDAISTSTTLTAPSVVEKMDQPNGASIEDPALDNPNYKLDPNEERYTYSIWDLQNWEGPADQGGFTYSNGGYYVTFSVDRSTVGTTTTPVVHARLVEKATGKEVETLDMTAKSTYQFKTLVQENPTYTPQFEYTSGEASQILGTWTNNRDAGPTSDDKYKHHILQIRDTTKPGNVGDTKPNVQTVVPTEKVTHTTHYKVEGTDEELASYAQTGIESQTYHASNPRTFEGYEFTRTQSEKDMTGSLGGVGAKYLELQGGRAHYYVKRIVEQVDKDGTSVVKLYALDPSKVSSYSPATDVNNLNLDNYTLLYTSDPVKPGGKPTPAGTKDALHDLGYVDSKDGQYHLRVQTYTDSGNGNVRLSGWYNKATGDAFTASPQFSADVDPVRNNTSNIIGGNTPGDKASGYPSFFNNYSLPSIKQISTDVTHYYRKTDATGNVYVHYQDTEGKTINPDVTDEKDQPINKAYDTVVDNRPQEITFEGKIYELVPAGNYTVGEVDDEGHLKSSDPTTGAVAKEDKNVTYIYKLKEGEVVITYVDENGKEIQKPRQDTPNSPYDTPYDTTEKGEKPNFIKAEDGKTYKIVPKGDYPVGKVDENGHLEKSDPVTGKVTKPKSTITYVYKEVNGNVYVHYKDTEGNELKTSVTDMDKEPVDSAYDTVVDNRPKEIEKDGKTYVLVPAGNYTVGEVDDEGHLKSTDPTTGKVAEQDKNVTYIYKLKEEPVQPKGSVFVHYKDTEGNELKTSVTDMDKEPVDSAYDTVVDNRPEEIEKDGKTYVLVPAGNYTVGEVDDEGHLKSTDPTTGKVAEQDKNVTYIYKLKEEPVQPKGSVFVHYKDTEGNELKTSVTDMDKEPVDSAYDTVVDNRPKEIEKDGKTYVLVPAGNYTVGEVDDEGHLKSTDATTGKVAEQDKNVTYIYKLKEEPVQPKGSVFVHYKDTEGNELKTSVTDMDKEPVDSAYDTVVDNRPKEIEKDGKTYVLVPAGNYTVGEVDDEGHLKSTDPTTGKVAEQDKNVTYIYKLKEEPVQPKGSVFVHYKDTEGNELKASVTDMDKEPVDSAYDTVVDNRPKEIEKDGKTYVLVPAGNYPVGEVDDQGHLTSSDDTTGKVAEQDKNVTYIYKLKEEPVQPKGSVYVHYKDTEGNELKASVTDMDKEPVDSAYDTVVDNRPKEIEKDGKTYVLVPAGNYPVGEVDDQGHLTSSDDTTGKVAEQDKNVTYIYKLKEEPVQPKGSVYVHYKDTEGNELKASVTDMDKEPVDSAYDTVVDNRPKEIEKDGKTYVLVPAGNYTVGEVDDEGHLKSTDPTTGKVAEQDKNVTYIYKLKEEPVQPKGSVFVHYKDTEGNELKTSVTDMDKEPVDSAYDTVVDNRPQEIEKDGKTYELVPAGNYTVGEVDDQGHLKSTDPTTGKVIEGDKNVTYVYKLKETPAEPKGNVYVHYVDTEGKTIKSDVTDEDAQPVDKDYDTVVDNRPQEIEKDGKTYELVPAGNYTVGEVDDQGHLKSTDPTTGKVIEGDKNVTYVYKLKEEPVAPKGNVYVHYVDTEGKTIKSDVTDEEAQPVDKDYDTVVDNRPQEIEKDGKTYELVPAGNYTVGEVDDQGHLKSTDPTTGKVIEGDKNVTYVYKLKEEPVAPKGNVYVHYVDTEGKTIKSDVTDEEAQPVDKDYDTVVDNRPQEIEKDGKTYELVPAGNYTVGEVDDQGHLKSTDPTTGKVIEGDKNVTYVYKLKETPAEPKGNVYVHYVDTEGKTIKSDVTDEDAQPVDKDYDTVVDNRPQEIEKDGKTYELVPAGNYTVGEVDDQGHLTSSDDTTGKVAEQDKNVTYIYKLKEEPVQPKGSVFVHYKDTEGNELKASVTDMDKEPVDSAYDTVVDNRPKEIEKDGKTYVLVPAGNYPVGEVDDQGHLTSSDDTTGKVAEQDKNVTYIYKLKEEPVQPKGSVYVHYKDTEGNELKASVTDMDKEPVDSAYDTVVDNRPKEIEKDGKTYVLVPAGNYPVGEVDDQGHLTSSDDTTGKVAEQDKNVTYIYKLKEEPVQPKGSVYVHYKDTEGNELKASVTDMDKEPVDSAYDTVVDNRPKEIEKDGKTYVLVPAGNYPVGEVDDQGHLTSSDDTTGKVAEQDKNVTYIYKLKEEPVQPKGSVYVHYKDTEGNELKASVTDMDKEPVDSAYDTVVDNRPKEIEKDGKTYVLVPAGNYPVGEVDDQGHLTSSDDTTGKVAEQDKNVTYVYKLKETPDKPVEPTPDKPVEPTPDKPVEPTPDKPVNPTPGKPVNPTPGKPVNPTPGKPVNPTPGKPVDPTPGKPVNPTPGKPVDPTPGKPVNPTPGKPVDPTPGKPVSEQPANPTSAKEQLPNTGETTSAGSTVLGVVAGLVGLAALGRRKKEDEK